jgi:hypothetical protein
MSRVVFKKKNECPMTSTFFLLNYHFNITCLVVRVNLISKCRLMCVCVCVCFFPPQVTLHVHVLFCASFGVSNVKNLQKLCQKRGLNYNTTHQHRDYKMGLLIDLYV